MQACQKWSAEVLQAVGQDLRKQRDPNNEGQFLFQHPEVGVGNNGNLSWLSGVVRGQKCLIRIDVDVYDNLKVRFDCELGGNFLCKEVLPNFSDSAASILVRSVLLALHKQG